MPTKSFGKPTAWVLKRYSLPSAPVPVVVEIVCWIKDASETLPYLNTENRVDEEHGSHLGEVSELDPGQSGALTITLKPGMYALFCNIPQHYMDGMWTLLTVTK